MKTALSASIVLCAGLLACGLILVTMLVNTRHQLTTVTQERDQAARSSAFHESKLREATQLITDQTDRYESLAFTYESEQAAHAALKREFNQRIESLMAEMAADYAADLRRATGGG